jgi:hypothetical protein
MCKHVLFYDQFSTHEKYGFMHHAKQGLYGINVDQTLVQLTMFGADITNTKYNRNIMNIFGGERCRSTGT